MITLRPKRDGDGDLFYRLRRDGFLVYAEGVFGPWNEDREVAAAAKDFAELPIEIVERDGAAIGYQILLREADHLFLDEVVVADPERNRGVGTELVQRVMLRARTEGVELRLSVLANNPAQSLYERLGFRITRTEPPRVKMSYFPDARPRIRCSVYIAASLDGYIARSDGAIDWLASVEREGEDYGFATFYDSVDTLIMGRTTYETALGFDAWPYEGKRVVVLTHRPIEPRDGVETARGTPDEILAALDDGVTSHIYVDGGNVIAQFLAARAIDRLTLSIIPILLGDGIRLFQGGEGEHVLALASTRAFPSGLVQLRYVAGHALG